ncbi:MAG: hypothetical protein KatS3mg076_1654 [Candidatus Binatia bacterium]|nr:MAG: hypothetical protein KatS3mg076_1654 [Candidatus Binatia bacterium]
MNTTQITVVLDSPADQKGLDGQPCTTDDVAPPGIPGTIPLTTGTGNALVVQPDNGAVGTTLGTTTQCIGASFGGSATGQAFGNLLDVERSILSGGRLSGAFPALHALLSTPPTTPGLDSVTAFNLECQ